MIISLFNFAVGAVLFDLFLSIHTGKAPLDPNVIQETAHFLNSGFYVKNLFFWTLIVVLTIIFLNVNEKYGHGMLGRLLIGRYHRPREEERIFMFVDMKSSTTIAERLGHINFFNLLNDFFRDITNPVVYNAGEIYQYVGDELVVCWTMENGIKNANCIRCFYDMQEAIQKKSKRYRRIYGIVPEFKAGLHCGLVTVGEIGVIKKDIVFSGDVLNTASRIQSLCNGYGVKILLSKTLLDRLHLPPHSFNPNRVGIIELKGKRQRVNLYTFGNSERQHVEFRTIGKM
jgi:adenylate cyclase